MTQLSLLCLPLSLLGVPSLGMGEGVGSASSPKIEGLRLGSVDSLASAIPAKVALRGVVKGASSAPLSGVYIEVYVKGDSLSPKATVLSGADGGFAIPELQGLSHLVFQHLGYEPKVVSDPIGEGVVVEMSERKEALGEVVVEARRPQARLTAEGFSFVPNAKELKLSSVEDYISRLPFVSGRDGSYSVFGKGKAMIYINNRPMRDDQELKDLNMEDILGVEVITEPGASYVATVPAVIKIRTKVRRQYSIGGDVYLTGEYRDVWSHWERASAILTTPKLSAKVLYSRGYNPQRIYS